MSTKEQAIKSIQELPDDADWVAIEERIRFLAALERGMDDIRQGKVVPHEAVKRDLEEWLTT